jgi:hypothetical protein
MKTLKKNAWLIAMSVMALILASALIVGCIQPSSSTSLKINDSSIPKGMGSVVLNFGNSLARTIAPVPPVIGDFKSFTVTFTPVPAAQATIFEVGPGKTHENFTAPFVLALGNYTLQVIGYTNDDWTEPVARAATETGGGISIVDMGGAAATQITIGTTPIDLYIQLKPYAIIGSGNGNFAFGLTSDYASAFSGSIVLTQWGVVTPTTVSRAFTDTTGLSSGANPIAVTSGYYYVDLQLTTGASGGVFKFRDIAHIYQNMTSTFTYMIDKDLVIFPTTPPTTGNGNINIDYLHPDGHTITFSIEINLGNEDYGDGVNDGDGKSVATAFELSRTDAVNYPTQITLKVSPDTVYEWCWGTDTLGTPNADLTLTAASAPFAGNADGVYPITVIVTYNGGPYTLDDGRAVYIKIVP